MTTCSPRAPSRTATAVSASPSSAISRLNTVEPEAVTRTISGTKNRAMSRSWIIMSRKIPPDPAR